MVIAPSIESERAVEGNGNPNRGDVDGDGMASSGNIDSMRVSSVRLAGEAGQHERTNAEMKMNIPVSPKPPVNDPKRLCRAHRPHRRCGRIKIEPINVSSTQNGGNTYLKRIHAIQLMWRPRKHVRTFNKLTFKYRKQGECCHEVDDYR